MPILKMVRLQFDQNKQFKITIPKQLCLAKGWKKGDRLGFEINETGDIIITKRDESHG
jgi:bifunctional DNA-binding transcriptional regulator/antitoxin component of YhaV-PrlF toxin-antitoxin module